MTDIQLLHEDLEYHLKGYPANPRITPAQRQCWRGQIKKIMLGYDHQHGLRLLAEIGGDGDPIDGNKATTVRCYSLNNEDHRWPNARTLVRFARFFHLDFEQALALVLKGQWEPYFAKRTFFKTAFNGARECEEYVWTSLFEALRDAQQAKRHTLNFQPGADGGPDVAALYALFEEHGHYASAAGYDPEQFRTLIHELILNDGHLVATQSAELAAFVLKQRAQQALLKDATAADQDRFWRAKLMWLEAQNTLGACLFDLEKQRLDNANIEYRWMKIFGPVYLAVREAEFRRQWLAKQIELKEADPELSGEAVEAQAHEALREEEARLRAERERIEEGIDHPDPDLKPMAPEQVDAYLSECKRVLRKIYTLTHPDHVTLENFTAEQQEALRGYFERAQAIRRWEWGLEHRPLPALLDILAAVRVVWDSMGINLDERLVIQGESLAEQLAWLERETVRMEQQIAEVRNALFALRHDRDSQEKQASLSSEPQIHQVQQHLEAKRTELEAAVAELEVRRAALLETETA